MERFSGPGPYKARAGLVTEIQRERWLPGRRWDLKSSALPQPSGKLSDRQLEESAPRPGLLLVSPLAEPIRSQGEEA